MRIKLTPVWYQILLSFRNPMDDTLRNNTSDLVRNQIANIASIPQIIDEELRLNIQKEMNLNI